MIRWLGLFLALWPGCVVGQTLTLPGNATLTQSEDAGLSSLALPVEAWDDGILPSLTFEGQLSTEAWRIDGTGLTTLQLLRPLRDQLRNAAFDVLLSCDTDACGGFDFRFAVDVIRPPAMQVNLGDFRFLSAANGDNAVTLMVSRTQEAAYVQITRIGPEVAEPNAATAAPVRASPAEGEQNLAQALGTVGRHILAGLAFETGSAQLGPGPYPALQELADHLLDHPDLTVALVGHTDASGSLDANIALSKRRAGSVLERLVTDYGVSRSQVEAQGNGYLAPIASNQTAEGREANRRVEVIVTATR